MTFHRYIEVPPGEPAVIPATTVHLVRDERGHDLGYRLEHGPGQQGAHRGN
jgi:hypothetical protein